MRVLKLNQKKVERSNHSKKDSNIALFQDGVKITNLKRGYNLITFSGLEKIPMTKISSRSPRDILYLKNLAEAIHCPVENLKSIVGLDEFKSILKKLDADNYNPAKKNFIANNHTHTKFSDGKADFTESLDEGQDRGKGGRNFLLAITDHDVIEAPRQAIVHIANDPDKYKNLRFVLGNEPCLKYENPQLFKMPIPFDGMAYCINPFDKTTIELFEGHTNKNKQYAREIFQKVNKRWGLNEKFEDAYGFHPLIKTGGSTGFFRYTKKYLETVLKDKVKTFVPTDLEELQVYFNPYYANQNGRATIATPDVEVFTAKVKERFGAVGIAHTANTPLNPIIEKTLDFTSNINLQNGIKYNDALVYFIKALKQMDVNIAEIYYQYPKEKFEKYPQFREILDIANTTCKNEGMSASGGTDAHGNTPGKILESR